MHFFAVAARAMRRVLIDAAESRRARKRGGGAAPVPLDETIAAPERRLDDLLALDEALDRLEQVDPRQVRVVECRVLAGLSLDETAAVLGVSRRRSAATGRLRAPGSIGRWRPIGRHAGERHRGPRTPAAHQRVFSAVVGLDAAHREAALADLCRDDRALAADVRSLLAAHETRGFVDELAERLAGATQRDETVPARIGRYDILDTIGRGGMGVVFKGKDAQLDRLAAIKVMAAGGGTDAGRRLLREARLAASLDHPSVVTIYEVGVTSEGNVFLAMAYYDGETLADRLARGAPPVPAVLPIAQAIAEGLAAAHARGITHRDLKPANVLLPISGGVKIVDFGIAQRADPEETRTGVLRGTPAYMAPEWLRGEAADPRGDVWAFGIMLHEMLTGARPDADAVASLQPHAPRAADRWPAAIPPPLAQVAARALSLDPRARYRDGAELVTALAEAAAGSGGDVPAVSLPTPLTRFLGREREVDDIARRLTAARLLTLTGPGGTGKTRLALQVASRVSALYAGGAAFVPLAATADPAFVCSAIARALSVEERPNAQALDTLVRFCGTGTCCSCSTTSNM